MLLASLLLTSCDRLDIKGVIIPTAEGVEVRFEESMEMTGGESVATIACDNTYSLYLSTDTHIYETYNNLRHFATLLRNDAEAALGVMLGDCIDHRDALPLYVEALERVDAEQPYNTPIFSLLGNHDLFFSGWRPFAELLGPSVYWFEVSHTSGSDLFVALDSANGTLGGKQMRWLEELLAEKRNDYRHCVVLTHTNIFNTDNTQVSSGNMPIEESHHLLDLFSRHRVTLCLQGHDHHREDLTFGGVRYTVVGTISDEAQVPEYLIVHLSDSGVEYEWMTL